MSWLLIAHPIYDDVTIADFALATHFGQIKTGSLSRSARYAGPVILKR